MCQKKHFQIITKCDFRWDLHFSPETRRTRIDCKYIETNSVRTGIFFFLGENKCRANHEVENLLCLGTVSSLHIKNTGAHA